MWAGESCTVVKAIRPAGEIVRELAREAAAALAAAAAKQTLASVLVLGWLAFGSAETAAGALGACVRLGA
jgi:hypothetical protein